MTALVDLKKAASRSDLAKILGYKPSALSHILYVIPPEAKYTEFEIDKKSGGKRKISAPIPQLKTLQRHLANILYECREEIEKTNALRPLSHGFRKGHSIMTNANKHKGRRYVLNIDLENFFPSINFGRVRGFFMKDQRFDLNERVATTIAQIACYHGDGLPQGSPCSPIISDLVAHILDMRMAKFSKRNKITYTRYADDITFSTNRKEFPLAVAHQEAGDGPNWILGEELT